MNVSWGVFFVILYLYRAAMSIVAVVFVSRFTTLGDSFKYQKQERGLEDAFGRGSTSLTEVIGGIFSTMANGNVVLINLAFMTIGYIGIFVFMIALPPRYRIMAAILVMLPSFNLWTSIASKECVILFFAGFTGALFLQIFLGHQRTHWSYLAALPGLFLYKWVYFPAVALMLGGVVVARFAKQPALFVLFGVAGSAVALYLFRDVLSDYSFQVPVHFLSGTGLSTREAFWVEKYDVFTKAPYGMWLAFFGPTLAEAQSGHLLHLFSFIESTVILTVLMFIFLSNLPNRPIFSFLALLLVVFWLMFPNYPLGVMNPGSAVRYRAGYYLLLVAAVMAFSSRDGFVRWRTRPLWPFHA